MKAYLCYLGIRHRHSWSTAQSLRVAQKLLRTQEPWKCCFDVREIVRLCEWCFNVKSALPKSCDIVLMGDEGARRLFPHILPGTLQSFHHCFFHTRLFSVPKVIWSHSSTIYSGKIAHIHLHTLTHKHTHKRNPPLCQLPVKLNTNWSCVASPGLGRGVVQWVEM